MNTNSIPENALILIKNLIHKGYSAYLVGGCVRDLIMGKIPNDYDICTDALPKDIIELINELGYKHIDTGIKYGTVVALCNDEQYEITTYRLDGSYTDNRHPENVEFASNIEDDLARRDFTINAIAYNPYSNEYIDIYDGLQDIKDKVIRAVGDADLRFKDDALRIMRALRFAIKYQFDIEDKTLVAMRTNVKLLDNISKERITSELEKILTSNKPIKNWFTRCSYIITQIIPEIKTCIGFEQHNKYHEHDVYTHILHVVDFCDTNKFEIKLAALLHDIGKPESFTLDEQGNGHFYGHPEKSYEITENILNRRLRITRVQSELVLNLVRYHDMYIEGNKKQIKRKINKHGIDFLNDWFILKEADFKDHVKTEKLVNALENARLLMSEVMEEVNCFSLKDLAINGNDLKTELYIKEGKQIGIILNTLLMEVIDDKIKNEKVELIKQAKRLIQQM